MKKALSDKMTVIIVVMILAILAVAGIRIYLYESEQAHPSADDGNMISVEIDENHPTQSTNPQDDGFGSEVPM